MRLSLKISWSEKNFRYSSCYSVYCIFLTFFDDTYFEPFYFAISIYNSESIDTFLVIFLIIKSIFAYNSFEIGISTVFVEDGAMFLRIFKNSSRLVPQSSSSFGIGRSNGS